MNLNPLVLPAAALTAALFAAGVALARAPLPPLARRLALVFEAALAVPGLLFVFYYTHLFDSALWFYRLRAAPATELLAAGMGLLAGALYAWLEPQTRAEKAVIPAALLLLILAPHAKPILAPLDPGALNNDCPGEVCFQSTPATCGPASAATLLKALGRPTSERELAAECYTYRGGTESWYLARAFRRRGFHADFTLQPPTAAHWPTPAIAGMVLRGPAGHFIALLDQTPGSLILADPLHGKLILPKRDAADP